MLDASSNESPNTWVYVTIAAAFILFIVFLSIFLYFGFKSDWWQAEDEIEYKTIILRAVDNDTSDILGNVSYHLKQDELRIQEGKFHTSSLEKFSRAINGSNYTLESWGEDYYLNEKDCTFLQERCVVELIEIGHGYSFHVTESYNNLYRVSIYVNEGHIQEPLICLRWNDIFNMEMEDLDLVAIPSEYQNRVDKCYQLLYNLQGPNYYDFILKADATPVVVSSDVSPSFTVFFDDLCENPDNECVSGSERTVIYA